jgi:hemerythrin-like domain-containing protein
MSHDLLPDAGAPSFDDPLALLEACHGRIRRQLATLARLQRHLPEHGCDDDARTAARAILRYFDTAAPNHHADEEVSVFPRVVAHTAAAKPIVARLLRDHEGLAANWRHLRPLLAAIAAGERANLDARTVREVDTAYASHITVEENELIPLAREVLAADEIAAIGREMAARRNIEL